ncbi:hypothetical protein ACOSQ3_013983 [Xanthoceras sorbifolium]
MRPASETLKMKPDGVLFSNGPGDPSAVPYAGIEVTHVNLNDGTCAGLAYPALNVMSLQYHPDASPGPHDSDCVFREFVELMKSVEQRT